MKLTSLRDKKLRLGAAGKAGRLVLNAVPARNASGLKLILGRNFFIL